VGQQPEGARLRRASAALPLLDDTHGIACVAAPCICPPPLAPKCEVILARTLSCREILEELKGKLQSKFDHSQERADAAVAEIEGFSQMVVIAGR
jgi:hypothetical protein